MPAIPFKPELLAPGGSLEKCRIAFLYGADAVYAGGKRFGLRAFARNLDDEEIATAAFWAHQLGKKLYVTVNIFARESDLRALPAFLEYLQEISVDAIIVSDPGVLALARRWAPKLSLHLSTQANTTNSHSVSFWRDQSVSRINLARELTFRDLQEIRSFTDAELEVFVHGAMCVSYSGRCLLSSILNQRSANLGSCTQPCRWSYRLVEEKRPGQYFPVAEDSGGSYIFNSKDLCLLEELGRLMALRIDAFKIEGRMKGSLYLASVIRSYRQAIDAFWHSPASFHVEDHWRQDLQRVSHRPYTKGFLLDDSGTSLQEVSSSVAYLQTHTLAGIVRALPHEREEFPLAPAGHVHDVVILEVRSRLTRGTVLEFLYPDGSSKHFVLDCFENMLGNQLTEAHPNSWIRVRVPFPTFPLQIVRTRRN